MALYRARSAAVIGVDAHPIDFELDMCAGTGAEVARCFGKIQGRRRGQRRYPRPGGGRVPPPATARLLQREDPAAALAQACALDDAGARTLVLAVRRMGLSARAHDRILKAARTIADLAAQDSPSTKRVAQAVQYRSPDWACWS